MSSNLKYSKVQALYDHCKNIFMPSGIAPPSSEDLKKLSSILDTIQPADVGITEETANDDQGLIKYVPIHECDRFTISIISLLIPNSSVIPLHDHTGMIVFSKPLYGSMHVKAHDWVEPPCYAENEEPGHDQVRLAKLETDEVLTAPCEARVLYPKHGGNLHCFTAVTPCAMLDILFYPEGRTLSYYDAYPYSKFSAADGPNICDSEKEEHAWLMKKVIPEDALSVCLGEYAGPTIQL